MRDNLQVTIARIYQMEKYFDEVMEAVSSNLNSLKNDASIQEKLQKLSEYYESGLWLHDYERDERGELPADLKRGVLSQDALYNLLCEVSHQN